MSHLSHNVGVKEMPASGQLLGHLFDQHTLLVNFSGLGARPAMAEQRFTVYHGSTVQHVCGDPVVTTNRMDIVQNKASSGHNIWTKARSNLLERRLQ